MRRERLNPEILGPFVARALGCASVEIQQRRHELVHGSWEGKGNLVVRCSGTAQADGTERDWAIYLKIPRPRDPARDEVQREPLLYGSGVLDDLPGPIEAPHCLGVEDVEGDEPWIWLQEAAGTTGLDWGRDRVMQALGHLGEFQGAYLCDVRLPPHSWIDRSYLVRREMSGDSEGQKRTLDELMGRPATAGVFAGSRGERLRSLLQRRPRLVDAVERLPRTFTHGDMNLGNMIAPGGSPERTVLIDWHFSGGQPIGYDVSNLIGCCCLHPGAPYGDPQAFIAPALDAYLEGVRRSGWQDTDVVRFGCLAHLALANTVGVIRQATQLAERRDTGPERLEALAGTLEHLLSLVDTMWAVAPEG